MVRTNAGAIHKGLFPIAKTDIEEVHGVCLPWEGPHVGAQEECEEEGAAETMSDELTTSFIPCPSFVTWAVEEESKFKPRKNREEKGILKFCFSSHYPTLV